MEKLSIPTKNPENDEEDNFFCIFKPSIPSSIGTMGNIEKNWTKLDSIYNFVSKIETSNVEKDKLSKIILRLIDHKTVTKNNSVWFRNLPDKHRT